LKKKRLRVGVLASGKGTDLQSIIDASEAHMIDAEVVIVLSDKKDAYALERAKNHGIDAVFVNPQKKTKEQHENEMNDLLEKAKVDLIVGAGYMRILSAAFVRKWYGKLINIHPALLPSFKGTNGQGDSLVYGVRIAGCTTHFMDEEMDHGPIILQAAVHVHENDTRDSLAERILMVEHQILPRTIQLIAEGRVRIKGRYVEISPGDSWLKRYPVIPDVLYSKGY
jgi:phosphoribosylglycinamide formyltransferase-1